MGNKKGNIIWGILIIAVGLLYGAKELFGWEISLFFKGWWTLFLIVPGVVGILKTGLQGTSVGVVLVGILLLLNAQNVISGSSLGKLIVASVIVSAGISVLFREGGWKAPALAQGEKNEYFAVFSGQELRFGREPINGMKLNAVFGGVEAKR